MIVLPDFASPDGGDLLNAAAITVDDFLLGTDLAGVAFVYETLDGWHLGGGVDSHIEPRPGQHGSYDGPTYRRARVITLTGWIYADTRPLLMAAVDRLATILFDGRLGSFTVDDPDLGSRTAMVRLSAQPEASDWTDTTVRWQVVFTAPDYRKYGLAVSLFTGLPSGGTGLLYPLVYPLTYGDPDTGGRISYVNEGTAAVQPVITVHGPLSAGFQVTHLETARRLRYEHPVGSDVVLDSGTGTVTVDGQERSAYLTVREWFTVPPGASATFTLSTLGSETAASTPTAGMTVAVASAYI